MTSAKDNIKIDEAASALIEKILAMDIEREKRDKNVIQLNKPAEPKKAEGGCCG